ncbi:hypothetical protein G5V59_26965 [Nocardioides sp. W3-2-3]|uniref:hypothetical protein n=1 Tax=Nocardioides convexus TaxID=2712224 RepID=UPI0024189663|nr:hypothetical protein [Nocardioides convexus]NHA02034.1 hypothetical protein [Nocardioides convexus]
MVAAADVDADRDAPGGLPGVLRAAVPRRLDESGRRDRASGEPGLRQRLDARELLPGRDLVLLVVTGVVTDETRRRSGARAPPAAGPPGAARRPCTAWSTEMMVVTVDVP